MDTKRRWHKAVSVVIAVALAAMLLLLALPLQAPQVAAATEGPRSPATASTAAEAPYSTNVWVTPGNVNASDNTYASIISPTFDSPDYSYVLYATNFGFNIPTGSSIQGILVQCERHYEVATVADALVQPVKGGTRQGDNKSTGLTWQLNTDETVSFGGSTDLWGLTWTVADINTSDFGVAVAAQATGTQSDAFIDHLQITVYYNESPVAPTLSTPFDGMKTLDTTPRFSFSTTDPEGDSVEYHLQWSTDYTFATGVTDKYSSNYPGDAGWTATTFASGALASYAGQSADAFSNTPADTANYWRVRAIDPSGSNTWGSWSAIRNFTVDDTLSLAEWFQTTDEQFDTGTLTNTETSGSDSVCLTSQHNTPVFDNVTTDSSSETRSSATFSHTVGAGSARLLLVVCMMDGNHSVSGITYGGVGNDLTLAKRIDSASAGGTAVEIWYLINPLTGANNVVVNYTESQLADGIAAISYTGVNQSSPIGATAADTQSAGSNATVDITTTTTNSLIVGGLSFEGGDSDPFTPGTGTTERWDFATGTHKSADIGCAGGEEATTTAGTYTFDFTASVSDDWVIAAVELKGLEAFSSSGTIMSPPVDNDWLGGPWNEVNWTEDETGGTIKVQVYYKVTNPGDTIVPDVDLPGNSTGFTLGPIDISGLDTTTYNEISIKATLEAVASTPYLQDWKISLQGMIISFTVTDYGDAGLDFGTLDSGDNDNPEIAQNGTAAIRLEVGAETNVNVDIQLRGDDFSDGDGHTLPLQNPDLTYNVKHDDDNILNEGTETGLAESTLTTSYETWYSVAVQVTDHTANCYYWISIPSDQYGGQYASTFYYQAAKQ